MLGPVQVFDERLDAAVVVHLDPHGVHPTRVGEHQTHARIQEREFAQPVLQGGEIELGEGEGFLGRQKRDFGAGTAVGGTDLRERRLGLAVVEADEPFLAVAPDTQVQLFR